MVITDDCNSAPDADMLGASPSRRVFAVMLQSVHYLVER